MTAEFIHETVAAVLGLLVNAMLALRIRYRTVNEMRAYSRI